MGRLSLAALPQARSDRPSQHLFVELSDCRRVRPSARSRRTARQSVQSVRPSARASPSVCLFVRPSSPRTCVPLHFIRSAGSGRVGRLIWGRDSGRGLELDRDRTETIMRR